MYGGIISDGLSCSLLSVAAAAAAANRFVPLSVLWVC